MTKKKYLHDDTLLRIIHSHQLFLGILATRHGLHIFNGLLTFVVLLFLFDLFGEISLEEVLHGHVKVNRTRLFDRTWVPAQRTVLDVLLLALDQAADTKDMTAHESDGAPCHSKTDRTY